MSDNASVQMTAAEYLQRTASDAEHQTSTGDAGLIQFPGTGDGPGEDDPTRDDMSLAAAFMRHLTQNGELIRFASKDLLWRHNPSRGIWQRLSGTQTCEFNERLYQFVRDRLAERGQEAKATGRYGSTRRILFETLSQYRIEPGMFDQDHDLIAFANDVYDLAAGELRPHSPDHMLTIGRDYEYDAAATCPRFERFLDEVLVRHMDPAGEYSPLVPDPELRLLVQEMMGYCLATHCRAERGFFFLGEGRNGKSKLIEVIRHVVGETNVADFDLRDLGKEQMRLGLLGKLVAIQTELDAGTTIPDGRFKALVSGEPMAAKEVYKAPVSFKPFVTVIMAGNNLPSSRDRSKGMWARIVVIPFLATFEGENADTNLQDEFGRELPGIFNFAIEGYRRLRDSGWRFTQATAALQATRQYREEADSVLLWFGDCLRPSATVGKTSTSTLYESYVAYCTRYRYSPATHVAFGKRLKQVVDGREGRPWGVRGEGGCEFDMSFHRDAASRGYVGHFAVGEPV